MPELNVLQIAIIALMTVVGAVAGWILRTNRAQEEKAAVSAGWQEQINLQRTEHDRLTDQNKALMEQISQYQASNKDAKNRAKELSEAVQEAFARRDELQREIKDIRGVLEVAMNERDQLQSDISSKHEESESGQEKDARIGKLQRELENWQDRLPPLIEKFRQRNADAERLAADLAAAETRVAELEATALPDETRIEPVRDPDTLTDGRDACNDPIEDNDADEQSIKEAINGARDKLQAIKGIGPAIEKTLNELGIFQFQQIAEMSEYDIDRVAKRLKGFRSRIYREDWIGQARELHDQAFSD